MLGKCLSQLHFYRKCFCRKKIEGKGKMRKVREKKKSNLRNSGAINHHTRWYSSVNSVQSYQFKKKLHGNVPLRCRRTVCLRSLPISVVSQHIPGAWVWHASTSGCLQSLPGSPTVAFENVENFTQLMMCVFAYRFPSRLWGSATE